MQESVADWLAAFSFPQSGCMIFTASNNEPAVGAKRRVPNPSLMLKWSSVRTPIGCIPEACAGVSTVSQDNRPIRVEHCAAEPASMRDVGADRFSRSQIPEPRGAIMLPVQCLTSVATECHVGEAARIEMAA